MYNVAMRNIAYKNDNMIYFCCNYFFTLNTFLALLSKVHLLLKSRTIGLKKFIIWIYWIYYWIYKRFIFIYYHL